MQKSVSRVHWPVHNSVSRLHLARAQFRFWRILAPLVHNSVSSWKGPCSQFCFSRGLANLKILVWMSPSLEHGVVPKSTLILIVLCAWYVNRVMFKSSKVVPVMAVSIVMQGTYPRPVQQVAR